MRILLVAYVANLTTIHFCIAYVEFIHTYARARDLVTVTKESIAHALSYSFEVILVLQLEGFITFKRDLNNCC